MPTVITTTRRHERGGLSVDLAATNEIPLERELIVEFDTAKAKIGDGISHYNDLAYIGHGGNWGSITGTITDQNDLKLALDAKQPLLISGTNIKTVNSQSIVGAGNISIASTWGAITGTLSSQSDLNSALSGKQATLVSGTNIKTVNGQSLLGSGNITISGGGSSTWGGITGTLSSQTDLQSALNAKQATLVSSTNIRTINSQSLLGSGDIIIAGGGTIVTLATNYSNSLATAISTIGSVPTTLIIDADTTVSTALTVPTTLTLRFTNKAKISKSGSGAIAFAGIGIEDPESKVPIFAGFGVGDITWTGSTTNNLPRAVSTELWDTGNVSLTDRIARADAAFPTQYMRIVCHPRTMTATVLLHQNRFFWFSEGDYLNTSTSNHSIFWTDSNTTYTGTRLARLHESSNDYNDMIIGMKNDALYDSYHDVHVVGLTFVGNLATAASAGSTVILGNTINGSIRDCEFHETKTYVTFGGAGDTGNYAENCKMTDNLFTRVPNQQAVIINGKNCTIARNIFDMKEVYWTNPATGLPDSTNVTLVDLESNGELDILENIIIEENLFDCRNKGTTFHSFFGGISVAGDGLNRSIIVRNNTFLSGNIQNNGDNIGPGTLTNIVHFRGVLEGYIYGNTARGVGVPISITESNSVTIHTNNLLDSYDGYGDGNSIAVRSSQDCNIYSNTITRYKDTTTLYMAGIYEYEQFITVSTSAHLITREALGSPGKFYPHMNGDELIINNAVYHIESVWSLPETESNTAKTVEALPTLAPLSMVAADVNVSTNVFHKVAHGHVTGSRVQVVFTDFANRFLPDLTTNHPDGVVTAHIIRVDADNFKLAFNYANALAGTAIDITSAGTSAYTVYPVLEFQRSRNRYWGNRTLDGIHLSKTALQAKSNSLIISCAEDMEVTEVNDTDHTIAKGEGIISFTALTAPRTAILPDPVNVRGKQYVVRDDVGLAAFHNITISGQIDGQSSYVLSANRQSVVIRSDGAQWTLVSGKQPLPVGNYALEFISAHHGNVTHGLTHLKNTDYGKFMWEALIKPMGSGYINIVSKSGLHLLAVEFVAGANGGYQVNGHVDRDNGGGILESINFQSVDELRAFEWGHIAVWYDLTYLVVLINGVPSFAVAGNIYRRCTTLLDRVDFTGGSDHVSGQFRIACERLFENVVPFDGAYGGIVRPAIDEMAISRVNTAGGSEVDAIAHFIFDYRYGNLQDSGPNAFNGYFYDTSPFNGVGDGLYASTGTYTEPIGNRDPSLRPQWVIDKFNYSPNHRAPKIPVTGADFYDSFGREDVHLGKVPALSLGTTEVGGAVWSSSGYGILNGCAFAGNLAFSPATINVSALDYEVQFYRPISYDTPFGATYVIYVRYTDDNNWVKLEVSEGTFGAAQIKQSVAGTVTTIGSVSPFGNAWTMFKVIVSGSTITAYRGNTSMGSATFNAGLTGTRVGFAFSAALLRCSEFAVII
jgi:hypothetical protein